MTNKIYKNITSYLLVLFLIPALASAHQPRITKSRLTLVPDPEISKAYYGKLTGDPDVYIIESREPFDLYVNVLVPDIVGQKKDVSATVLKDGKELAALEGINFAWKQFYEPFGADSYWIGPEYKVRAEAGTYEIRVWSSENNSKYSLATGEIEAFDFKEIVNVFTIIPKLKKNFFEVSPITFIKSPFGWGLIVVMYLLAAIVGLLYRVILKKFAKNSVRGVMHNIGKADRLLRLAIGAGLLLWAITTSWNPIIVFFSGFAFFEVLFSWCGFYAAIGKNTCPVNQTH
ncbi:MAG: DUF2892 domain-containing protein [Alphaproteobacteria bacterium]|nr:DUF2892 domain-containing protein [Alphaproteobacteria bacterium]